MGCRKTAQVELEHVWVVGETAQVELENVWAVGETARVELENVLVGRPWAWANLAERVELRSALAQYRTQAVRGRGLHSFTF